MKFIFTKELGRLAKWMRILGFDSAYFTGSNPSSLFIQALQEDRAIITRNHRLPQSRGMRILVLKNETLKDQLAQLLKALNIEVVSGMMFTRCTLCNAALKPIEKEQVKSKVPQYVFSTQEDFSLCPRCGRVYWHGSHWGNVIEALKEIKG